jgi:hypothetical protein
MFNFLMPASVHCMGPLHFTCFRFRCIVWSWMHFSALQIKNPYGPGFTKKHTMCDWQKRVDSRRFLSRKRATNRQRIGNRRVTLATCRLVRETTQQFVNFSPVIWTRVKVILSVLPQPHWKQAGRTKKSNAARCLSPKDVSQSMIRFIQLPNEKDFRRKGGATAQTEVPAFRASQSWDAGRQRHSCTHFSHTLQLQLQPLCPSRSSPLYRLNWRFHCTHSGMNTHEKREIACPFRGPIPHSSGVQFNPRRHTDSAVLFLYSLLKCEKM